MTISRSALLLLLAAAVAISSIACSDDDPASPSPADELVIIPDPGTVLIGRTIQFQAERSGRSAVVSWSKTSPAISITGTGVVRGIELGQAIVTATLVSDESIRATATVFVEPQEIESVEVFPSELTLAVGERFTLGVLVDGPGGIDTDVNWESGDTFIVTVSNRGQVQGQRVGRTLITATAVGDPGKKGFCLVEVIAAN